VRRQKQDVMSLYSSPAITVDHSEDDHSERNRKIFAAVATAVVFVVLVNTVGLFGIAAIGLLAGGLVK
jgi:F0F1-type ATP synthase membrane subunit a